jgi:hypothetical protein
VAAGFKVDVGEWRGIQTNATVAFDLRQDQNGALTGDAQHGNTDGDVLGGSRVDGSFFVCRVSWGDGSSVGNYQGTFGPDGSLTGVTFDEKHPNNQALWHADRTFPRA